MQSFCRQPLVVEEFVHFDFYMVVDGHGQAMCVCIAYLFIYIYLFSVFRLTRNTIK